MPFSTDTRKARETRRILLSGVSNTGKTSSLPSFIYGPYSVYEPDEREDAYTYAGDKKMTILSCPGEQGNHSLPDQDIAPHITSYYYQAPYENGLEWSITALREFFELSKKVTSERPDVLALDGIHNLWDHQMNVTTAGLFLQGATLEGANIYGRTQNRYAVGSLYVQTHNAFGQYLASMYAERIPLIVMTTWEDWKGGEDEREAGKPVDIGARRYLWPSIPGKMAMSVVGRFDCRVSSRLEKVCLHKDCTFVKRNKTGHPIPSQSKEHHVWQVLDRGDVRGLGIKGLVRIPKSLEETPFIHQNYSVLASIMDKLR